METVLQTLLSLGYAVAASLVLSGAFTWFVPKWHGALQNISTLVWIVTALIIVVGIISIATSPRAGNLITSLGYLIVLGLVLPLLGIGRLALPPGPGEKRDPNAPVLTPRQIAKVDALAAIVVGVTYGVLVWRLTAVLALA